MGTRMRVQEFTGSEVHRNIQRRLLARHAEIAADPVLGNGGRVLNVLDPEAFGWDRLVAEVAQDRFVALAAMDRATIYDKIRAVFGGGVEVPSWDVFLGGSGIVGQRCTTLTDVLPDGWTFSSYAKPDPTTIGAVQELNSLCGVAAMPAWYMRGYVVPQITTCIQMAEGTLAACALVSDRYHVDGPHSGTAFLGSVSVSPDHRGKGLGVAVTAQALIDSAHAYGWTYVLSQAASDNAASRAMLERCGLIRDPTRVTVAINASGAAITR
ncbi:MAG: GNAT family N-acetyltransferase [Pseudomonadota bacterium]